MAFLRIDKLSFAYPDARTRALDEISFSIDKGEYLVICGESGCGKTTLLRQIKPELTPAGAREGTVYFHDKNVHGMSPEETAVKIGFVQQDPDNQIVTDFVWHELAFGLENMALPTSAIRRRVSEMASFFGMEDWFHKKTYELSGGQKQMLNLASIMAMNPELLVLDEPTSMLDPLASQNLLQMVSRINRELGVAVIICEHRLEEVFQTADRVLLMEKGQIQLLDTPQWVAEELSRNLTDSSKNISRIYPGLPGAADGQSQSSCRIRQYPTAQPEGFLLSLWRREQRQWRFRHPLPAEAGPHEGFVRGLQDDLQAGTYCPYRKCEDAGEFIPVERCDR